MSIVRRITTTDRDYLKFNAFHPPEDYLKEYNTSKCGTCTVENDTVVYRGANLDSLLYRRIYAGDSIFKGYTYYYLLSQIRQTLFKVKELASEAELYPEYMVRRLFDDRSPKDFDPRFSYFGEVRFYTPELVCYNTGDWKKIDHPITTSQTKLASMCVDSMLKDFDPRRHEIRSSVEATARRAHSQYNNNF